MALDSQFDRASLYSHFLQSEHIEVPAVGKRYRAQCVKKYGGSAAHIPMYFMTRYSSWSEVKIKSAQ